MSAEVFACRPACGRHFGYAIRQEAQEKGQRTLSFLILWSLRLWRSDFLHGEGEVGVGERLVAQGEVPPLGIQGLKAVTHHGQSENHAVVELSGGNAPARGRFVVVARVLERFGIAAEVGMALRAEPVEGAAHVELLLRGHVEERQIDRRAARVSAMPGNILLFEKHALVKVWVEILLHAGVGDIGGPAHEVVDAPLRTVGIVYLQSETERLDVVADGTQAIGGTARQQGGRLQIAVDAVTHEVVGAEVAYFQNGIGHGVSQVDKLALVLSWGNALGV